MLFPQKVYVRISLTAHLVLSLDSQKQHTYKKVLQPGAVIPVLDTKMNYMFVNVLGSGKKNIHKIFEI